MAGWTRSSGMRATMSDLSYRSKPAPLYTDSPEHVLLLKHNAAIGFRRRLPHFFRSFKGLLGLLCLALIAAMASGFKWQLNSAAQQARWEAQLAERALSDPEFRWTEPAPSKWSLPWPSLSSSPASPPREPAPLSLMHDYNGNGLLTVNTASSKHPILELIDKGEQDWKRLRDRQSKNFTDVITEYKRRHKRNPPAGFDAWWKYTQENGVLLPDEYDQIERDLEPYRALDPNDLRHRAKVMQSRENTFTLVIRNGQVDIEGPFAELRRATDLADLIRRFAKDVPFAVNMTFIMDDSPAVLLQHESRARLVEMAKTGEHFGMSDYSEGDAYLPISNFARACPAESLLRRKELNESIPAVDTCKSFIWNSRRANDICDHPEIKSLHGHTQTVGTEVTPLVPLFSWAKMRTHSDILVTPLEQYWDSYIGDDPDWSLKSKAKLLWRGSTTGADFTVNAPWKDSQRARLHIMSRETSGSREVLWADENGQAHLDAFNVASMNELYLDTSFAGQPAQCDPETCEYMRNEMNFAGLQGLEDSYQYKYMIDVDGNAWSGRFHRLMSTKSVVLKSTVFPEWYADRLIPWYHYIPVKVDYSDLYDIMAFFVGTPDGRGSHDRIAHRLAENGRHWAKRYWRRADMASYMFRLVLEWTRLMHQGNEVDYVPGPHI